MSDDKPFGCKQCKNKFKTQQGLAVHVTRTHMRKEAKDKVRKNPFVTIGRKRKPYKKPKDN